MKSKPEKMEPIDKEVKQGIVDALHLGQLEESDQEKVVSLLLEVMVSRVTVELWKKLGKEQKDAMQTLLDDPQEENVASYLDANGIELSKLSETVVKKTLEDFTKNRASLEK